ncbi:hypothetical protein [Prochlorococcus marinus]|uniref:hypothetical protein n=1 Tax=Prochlorococcus marinus TaxID=1219 RepID=UPI0022B4F914|nr:hypothetical protein [Prochlorococcus marinus]
MDELPLKDIKLVKARYLKNLSSFGHDQKSLGWGEKGRQLERFKILIEILNISKRHLFSINDIGAGFGDLYNFLIEQGYNIKSYQGYELVKELCEQGNLAYGSRKNFKLFEGDFLEKYTNEKINTQDYSLMSGIFNFKIKNGSNYEYIESVLKASFNTSSIGIAANFITNRVDYLDEIIFNADPARIIDIAYNISRRFVIDHSYFPFEFSLAILKDQSFDENYPVFNDKRIQYLK